MPKVQLLNALARININVVEACIKYYHDEGELNSRSTMGPVKSFYDYLSETGKATDIFQIIVIVNLRTRLSRNIVCWNPRGKWKIAENTHEPLVTEERIEAHANVPKVENPLRSKIYCAGCGRKMFRRSRVTKGIGNYHFFCDSRRRMVGGECKQTYISEVTLMEAVKEAAEKQIQLLGTLRTQWMRQTGTAESTKKRRVW